MDSSVDPAVVTAVQTIVSTIAGSVAGVVRARGHGARLKALERGVAALQVAFQKFTDEARPSAPPASSSLLPGDGVADMRRDITDLKARLDKLEAAFEREGREFVAFRTGLSRELGDIGGKVNVLLGRRV